MIKFDKDSKKVDKYELVMPPVHTTLSDTSNKYTHIKFININKSNGIPSHFIISVHKIQVQKLYHQNVPKVWIKNPGKWLGSYWETGT